MEDLYICKSCWLVATPKVITKGSSLTEVLLWGLFVIPGIFYSSWRHISKDKVCPSCHSLALVPMNSIIGQKLFDEINSNRNTRFVRRLLSYKQDDLIRDRHQNHEIQYKVQ